jgi:hypothetical protein
VLLFQRETDQIDRLAFVVDDEDAIGHGAALCSQE